MLAERLHTFFELILRPEKTDYQPPLPGKAKETSWMHDHTSPQQEIKRRLFFRLQRRSPKDGIPPRLNFKPAH